MEVICLFTFLFYIIKSFSSQTIKLQEVLNHEKSYTIEETSTESETKIESGSDENVPLKPLSDRDTTIVH